MNSPSRLELRLSAAPKRVVVVALVVSVVVAIVVVVAVVVVVVVVAVAVARMVMARDLCVMLFVRDNLSALSSRNSKIPNSRIPTMTINYLV